MIAITLTISGFYSHYNKKEVIYHVTVPKTSSVSKLKICLVSDLHLSSGTYMRQVRKLVKTVIMILYVLQEMYLMKIHPMH